MRRLLVADPHFDDNPANEYRWSLFQDILAAEPDQVFILGDLCHKKDRHSAMLVNKLINALQYLTRHDIKITVLCGNHDRALKGPAYWELINHINGLRFITEPTEFEEALLLPHSNDVEKDWHGINFSQYKCLLMHQPTDGLDLGNGTKLKVPSILMFKKVQVYSGDPHYPQNVNGIEYLGTPHPINFGENHLYRMIVLDANWQKVEEIVRYPILKHNIIVNSMEELTQIQVSEGDQAKVEFVIPASRVDQWPIEREAIEEWAKRNGVTVSAIKGIALTSPDIKASGGNSFMLHPLDVLISFVDAEGLEDVLLTTGYNLLQEALAEIAHAPS